MRRRRAPNAWLGCLTVMAVCHAAPALAQDAAPSEPSAPAAAPITQPIDRGFGRHELNERYHFPDPAATRPRVDQRDELDAMSDRNILLPTAHTPDQYTLAFTNYMGAMNRLAFSPTDDLQLAATLVFQTPVADFHSGLSTKITLAETYQYTFSLQPMAYYHSGTSVLANRDFGLGVAGLVDLYVSNDLLVTLGSTAYGTVWAGTESFSYENCQTRTDYLDGSCRTENTNSTAFPSGGHFLTLQAGFTWYIFDQWSMRGEAISGVASGSVLGSEWVTDSVPPNEQREALLDGGLRGGVPLGSEFTAGLGLEWSNGLLAVQFSGYVVRAPESNDEGAPNIWSFVPMLGLGVAAF